MQIRTRNTFTTIRTEGAILPPDLLQRIADGDRAVPGLRAEDYHVEAGRKLNEAINEAWNRLLVAWARFKKDAGLGNTDAAAANEGEASGDAQSSTAAPIGLTGLTRERWLLPLFQQLGYGRLVAGRAVEIEGKSYPISHFWHRCPIHLIGCHIDLDRRTAGVAGAARASPHSLVQEYLNRTEEHLWGFVSNGLRLRILRDNASLTRQAFVEFDLQAMMDGEVYADFVLLWLLCHQSRVEAERAEQCWLEKWSKLAHDEGTRALDALRNGVQAAIEALGRGFLAHPANRALKERLQSGQLSTQDYYRQLLRLVYRLLFLFTAEDRALLLDPSADAAARERYTRFYSTARLRTLAIRRRGDRHHDLFVALRLVMGRLDTAGCPELGLPALGSFLWSRDAIPDLAECEMANCDLLDAVRALYLVEHKSVRRTVDYKNLGPEELGSVYESLLELHPELNVSASTFALRTAAGHERKTTGSYYTPTSLINCLLDSALDPVVDDRLKEAVEKLGNGKRAAAPPDAVRTAQERVILSLKVCDPACGSGHFLIAAAHRLAKRLAAIRTGDDEPAPEAVRHALRDVIGHCIYGVDINPMAVELCKVALWMEALEPGKPLSFLDHRIQCGNSLLGVTPALLARGIPDAAFEPIEGDDKAVGRELKRRNRDERKGQGQLWDAAGRPWERLGNLATAMVALDSVADDTLAGVQDKQRRWHELVQSSGYLSGRLLADAWCAAFVWKKTRETGDAITESVFRRIERNPHDLTPWMRDEIRRLAEQYKFFHWHLVFPDVFRVPGPDDEAENEQAGWSGGFDVVIGNPPWERIKLQEKEWFAERRPEIGNAPNAAQRRRMTEALREEDPAVYRAFLEDRRKSEAESTLVRDTERYPLCGRGDVNTYAVFAELKRSLLNPRGRVGCIVPSGIATDDTTKFFFQDLTKTSSLVSLHDFENRQKIFPAIDSRVKFCLLTMAAPGSAARRAADFVFFALDVADLSDPERRFTLSAEEIALLNPNTRTCPIFRSKRDAELTKYLYRRLPVLVREARDTQTAENPWGLFVRRVFDMNKSDVLSLCSPSSDLHDDECVRILESKLMHQFDHRWASYRNGEAEDLTPSEKDDPCESVVSRFWVPRSAVDQRLARRDRDGELLWQWNRNWLFAWRDITNTTNERTVIVGLLPRDGTDFTLRICFPNDHPRLAMVALLANLNSFALDYVARQLMGGTHLSDYITEQLAVVPRTEYLRTTPWNARQRLEGWLTARTVELCYVALDIVSVAEEVGYRGPPFRWNEERRFLIRCELDAAFFHLYLGTPQEWRRSGSPELLRYFPTPRDAVDYIMETFPIVKRKDEARYGSYRTKEVILSIYDEMAEVIAANEAAVAAGRQPTAAYRTRLDPPPGPPADAAGNFLALPEWLPGQPRPANWPRHIHAPREVHEWTIANGIDWRELLDGPAGVLPKPTRAPVAVPARPAPVSSGVGEAGVLPGFESAVAAVTSESRRREREKGLVVQAFRDVRDGRSPDYVIAAPDLNSQFLARARELGVESADVEINLMLYGARKASRLQNDRTTREYRLPKVVVPFVFASEWAIRHLQRELLTEANQEPSLDDILCNPELARRFDAVAARIKSGFSPLEYRWAALGLRKTGRQNADAASVGFPLNQQLTLFDLDLAHVPETPGLYLIQSDDRPLYVNATDNLRAQVLRHRDCAGQVLVPDWLSAARGTPTRLSFAALYGVDVKRLKEARIRHVADLQPWLNLLDLPGAA